MKRYHYHPDHTICVRNGDRIYYDTLEFAKFDLGSLLQTPAEGSTEFEYIVGYGTRNFSRTDLLSFSEEPRPELDALIENIEVLLEKQKRRGVVDDNAWQIPEDMKTEMETPDAN
jgi:hypothetical protein